MAKDKMSFEDSVKRLDEIVKLLERGDAPLSESLKLFEEGTSLISNCDTLLNEAEQKVVKLRKGQSDLLPYRRWKAFGLSVRVRLFRHNAFFNQPTKK